MDVKTTTNYCISLFINQHWVQFSFPYVTAENFLPALNFFQMLATTRPNPVRQTAQAKPCNAKTRASKYLRQFFCCLTLSVENFEIQLALTIFSFWLSILVLTTLSPLLWIVKCFGCYGLKRRIITLGGKTTVQLIFSFIELIYTKQDNMLLFEWSTTIESKPVKLEAVPVVLDQTKQNSLLRAAMASLKLQTIPFPSLSPFGVFLLFNS